MSIFVKDDRMAAYRNTRQRRWPHEFILLTVLVLMAGCISGEPKRKLVGMWKGGSQYIFIDNDNGHSVSTSLPALRGARVWDSRGGDDFIVKDRSGLVVATMALTVHGKPNADVLQIHIRGHRERIEMDRYYEPGTGLLPSLTTYTRSWNFLFVLYPDGSLIFIALYLSLASAELGMVYGCWVFSKNVGFLNLNTRQAIAVVVVGPVALGYLIGLLCLFGYGWWDPVRASHWMVVGMVSILVLLWREIMKGLHLQKFKPFNKRKTLRSVASAINAVAICFEAIVVINWYVQW